MIRGEMTNRRRRLVVMPAWNEAAVIGDTVTELLAVVPDVDLLVVDDGSTDNTVRVAEAAGARVLRLPFNLGVGGALRAGFKYAWESGYEQAIQVDADGQHEPSQIETVLAGLDRADISIGARFAGIGDYAVRGPRRWAMKLLSAAFTRTAGVQLTDVTSGFRAANRRAILQYTRHYPAEYLGDTVDSLMTAIRSGLTVVQVPVEMRPRQGGEPSHSPWRAAVYLVRSAFALMIALTRRQVPAPEPPTASEEA
jgi:glycosyltransferase involved in cell wall biosynthesis